MDVRTFQSLQKLREKYGPGIFGKIAQKLLAVAFRDAGFHHVVERGVQGVDIDVADDGVKYALEVKTTQGQTIMVSEDNLKALKDRLADGYTPMVAALRMQMFEEWVFAIVPLDRLQLGSVSLSKLRAYRNKELEQAIRPAFDRVVDLHFASVLAKGERYLLELLAQKRVGDTHN